MDGIGRILGRPRIAAMIPGRGADQIRERNPSFYVTIRADPRSSDSGNWPTTASFLQDFHDCSFDHLPSFDPSNISRFLPIRISTFLSVEYYRTIVISKLAGQSLNYRSGCQVSSSAMSHGDDGRIKGVERRKDGDRSIHGAKIARSWPIRGTSGSRRDFVSTRETSVSFSGYQLDRTN